MALGSCSTAASCSCRLVDENGPAPSTGGRRRAHRLGSFTYHTGPSEPLTSSGQSCTREMSHDRVGRENHTSYNIGFLLLYIRHQKGHSNTLQCLSVLKRTVRSRTIGRSPASTRHSIGHCNRMGALKSEVTRVPLEPPLPPASRRRPPPGHMHFVRCVDHRPPAAG